MNRVKDIKKEEGTRTRKVTK